MVPQHVPGMVVLLVDTLEGSLLLLITYIIYAVYHESLAKLPSCLA